MRNWFGVFLFACGQQTISHAYGQTPVASVTINGHVRSKADSTPLRGAQLLIAPFGFVAQSADSGSFVIRNLRPGDYGIHVRRLGYFMLDTIVRVSGGATELTLWLVRLPARLAEIEVRGKRILVPSRLQSIYQRAERSNGHLITAEDIKQRNPLDTKAMLEGIPGVRVLNYAVVFARCHDSGGAPRLGALVSSNKVHVYVNGHRVTNSGDRHEAFAAIQSVYPSTIELIEVYTGIARIPAEYLADACGIVALWTR